MRRIHYLTGLLIAMCLLSTPLHSAITVHNVKGAYITTKKGEKTTLSPGMKVFPADKVTIPSGGLLEVKNDVNNTIYTSTQEGTFTISRMMLDSKMKSKNNISDINNRLKIGGSQPDNGQRVYVEQGMVKRSLSEYDPQASMFSIDPVTLARSIREKGVSQCSGDSVFVKCMERTPEGALTIELVNSEVFPIYFNILSCEADAYSLSCLGQPSGSYVLLPHQGIRRNHPDSIAPSQKQILIVANCSFDVDLLIDELNKQQEHQTDPLPEFPLYLYYF